MIEAAAVFDEERFERTRDLFAVGGFYAVKGRLAQVLSRFDLGEGGLIPFPIYQADLVTPIKGEFFLLNFGARKSSCLPDQSINVAKFLVTKTNGSQIWRVMVGMKMVMWRYPLRHFWDPISGSRKPYTARFS